MAESERKRSKIVFEEEITTNTPDRYANLKLEIEGVPDKELRNLRKKFVTFWEKIEESVQKEISPSVE